jgi:hypothetical protein
MSKILEGFLSMSIKNLLGLEELEISDIEIMDKFISAQKKQLGEIEFIRPDGSNIKILLPK